MSLHTATSHIRTTTKQYMQFYLANAIPYYIPRCVFSLHITIYLLYNPPLLNITLEFSYLFCLREITTMATPQLSVKTND